MKEIIEKIIIDAKEAQKDLLTLDDKKINSMILFIIKSILNSKLNKILSEMAVKETGFGNTEDKIKKNENKTLNLLNEILPIKINKPIYQEEKKLYKILKPIGVICGSTPSTNPVATTLNYFINSIKCKNSIIICPNIRTFNTVSYLINHIKKKLLEKKFNPNIISIVPKNILRDEGLIYLFNRTDKNFITGNKQIINKVKKSTKPFLVFGTGNAIIIIENSADLNLAASSIIESKSFDNSTSCSSDSVLLIEDKIYKKFINRLSNKGLFKLNNKQKKKLDNIFFIKGTINPKLIAKPAYFILENLGVKNNDSKVIGYEISSKNLDHYVFKEKLLPICAIVKVKNSLEALELANNLTNKEGKGHSCGIYTESEKFIDLAGKKMDVSRLIINQPHSKSAGGSNNNYLNTTLSLGCGAWGESNIDHNLFYEDFCNKTLIVKKSDRNFLSLESLVSKYE